MKIINLIENTEGSSGCLFEHGLSFYVETKKHKLLVDTGATNTFIANAEKLGVDLKQVDTVILSHGHYDHTGGVLEFAALNPKAKIWMQHLACEDYYRKSDDVEKYIGIDKKIMELSQVEYVDGDKRIDDELFLFSGIRGRKLWPSGNLALKVKREDTFYQDEFLHEQCLVMEEDDKKVLISGCAHNGILNILEKYREYYSKDPDIVISGFHMQQKSGYAEEDLGIVRKIGLELKKTKTKFYTGHCTGEIPFQILKECMGEQLEYVHSGDTIIDNICQ